MRVFKHALASKAHAHACTCADMRADMHTHVLQLKAEVRRGIEISAGVTSKKEDTQEREAKWQRLRSEYEEQLKSMEECIKKERGAGARRNMREFVAILHRTTVYIFVSFCSFAAFYEHFWCITSLICRRTTHII